MSKSLVVSWADNSSTSFGDNTTRYNQFSGYVSTLMTLEAYVETPVRDAGIFSNLYSYASANTTLVNSTVTLRKNRADTAVIVTYTSGQTGIKEDTSNTVTFTNTDEANYKIVVANDTSGLKTITLHTFGIQFEPTTPTDCISFFGANATSLYSTASASAFGTNGRRNFYTSNETNAQIRVRSAFVSSDFGGYLSANTRTTTTTFNVRKNGADATQTFSFAAAETGAKEDTSNTDSFVVDDDFCQSWTTSTGTGSITIRAISSTWINTSNIFPLVNSGAYSQSFNVTNFHAVAGTKVNLNTTEANAQIYPRFDFTTKEMGAYVSVNTIATSATTVTLRDNGVDSAMMVSYAAAETGLKNDSSNTATITSGSDEINYSVVTPNTSGAITLNWIGMLGDTTVASIPGVFRRRRIRKFF